MVSILEAIRSALDDKAAHATRVSAEAYFKGAIRFIGVKRPGVTAVERSVRPAFAALTPSQRKHAALALLRSPFMEERQIGIDVLAKEIKKLPDSILDDVEALFDTVVSDWATCDTLCGKILRPLIVRSSAARRRIVGWSTHENIWKKRASAVAFVNEARKGTHDNDIVKVCTRIVKDPERFVQLGCGWVLRELFLADAKRVDAFIVHNAGSFSREGLRYAIEKMPAAQQRRLLDMHAAAAQPRRAPRSGRKRA